MSMETIDRYIQELEAIRNYDKVVKARDELRRKLATLEASLKSTSDKLAQYKELKVRLVDGGEISLDEARRDFLRAIDAEIEKRAGERFEALRREYETKMPHLVYQRLVEIVKGRAWPTEIAAVVRAEAEKRADRILYDKEEWPDKFKDYYQTEVQADVKSGLDSEFNRRVEESAKVKVQQRLTELVNAVWPQWFAQNIEPRITELERNANENVFQLLKGPWTFICDRCETSSDYELTPLGVEELLRKGRIQIECVNPACEDRSLFSSRRHRFQVSLHDLVEFYIRRES